MRVCPVCSTSEGVAYMFPFGLWPPDWPGTYREFLCETCWRWAHEVCYPGVIWV